MLIKSQFGSSAWRRLSGWSIVLILTVSLDLLVYEPLCSLLFWFVFLFAAVNGSQSLLTISAACWRISLYFTEIIMVLKTIVEVLCVCVCLSGLKYSFRSQWFNCTVRFVLLIIPLCLADGHTHTVWNIEWNIFSYTSCS